MGDYELSLNYKNFICVIVLGPTNPTPETLFLPLNYYKVGKSDFCWNLFETLNILRQ